MDAETQERLFEPFFTTKPLDTGTGLGLPTVYGIVKQSGGCIRVESEPGAGTTFEIFLPRTDGESERGSNGPSESGTLTGSETVLVVEDQPAVRSVVRHALERVGYRVLEAENGEAALAIYEREGEGIDLVLTDMIMPRMSGRDLADRLRASQPGIPILFMSGYAADEVPQHNVLEPGTHLLEKPFTAEVLQQKVREVLDRSVASGRTAG
jgi:CheY-like chemotaxis protein